VTSTVADTGKQVLHAAPPAAAPVTAPIEQALDSLVSACNGLPACP
jgi:hypothetical protein